MKTTSNILVGGSGFIGTALVDALIKNKESVVSISRDIQKPRLGVDGIVLDIGDFKSLESNFPIGDNVFILIGQNSDVFDPKKELQNIDNLVRILNITKPNKVFYFSSALVYGECAGPANESDILSPIDAYSRFKREAEIVLQNGLSPEIAFGILRLANVYGNPRNRGFINFLMRRLFVGTNEKISINGDGEQTRDYMFIDDVVTAILKVRDCLHSRDTVNIATGESHSLLQLVESISNVTNGTLPYFLNGKTLTEVSRSRISNDKLHNTYGFTATHSFEEGLLETFKRYQFIGQKEQVDSMLFLGGEGFIGRNLVSYFSKGRTCFSIGNSQSIFPYTENKFKRADPYQTIISDEYATIIHLIDHKVPVSLLVDQEAKLVENISLTSQKHVVLFSSSVVYANPDSEYGVRKRLLEEFYATYCAQREIPLTILRLFNTFGPFQFPYRPGSLVSNLIYNHLHKVPTDIKNIHIERDFIYSQDISKFVDFVVRNKLEGTFDVGSGTLISIEELIRVLEKDVLHEKISIVNKNITEPIVCPPARIAAFQQIELTTLADALRQTVHFYKDNLSFMKNYVERPEN